MTTISDPNLTTSFPGLVVDPEAFAAVGQQVGRDLGERYEVLDFLGHGAYATVWKTIDRVTEEIVAVKRFEFAHQQTHDFYRELRVMFRFEHPRIVKIVNFLEVATGGKYLILEYCGGGNLRHTLHRMHKASHKWTLEQLTTLAKQISQGLAVAHHEGLVHRDLKPENVLFTQELGEVSAPRNIKLADFGLTRVLRSLQDADFGGKLQGLSGSPAYMSPEQFMGKYSAGSDMYALGVVLYEAWHGRPLFTGTPEKLAYKHLREIPELDHSLPSFWKNILSLLLSKEPENRPSANELLEELRQKDKLRTATSEQRKKYPKWSNLPRSSFSLFVQKKPGQLYPIWQVVSSQGLTPLTTAPEISPVDLPYAKQVVPGPAGTLLFVQNNRVLMKSFGDLRELLVTESPIEAVTIIGHSAESPNLVIVAEEELGVWELPSIEGPQQPTQNTTEVPRKLWSGVVRSSGLQPFVCTLPDGRIACTEGPINPRVVVWDSDGTVDAIIELPGVCWQMGHWLEDTLYVNLLSGNHFEAYLVIIGTKEVEILRQGRDVISLTRNASDTARLYGLQLNGAVQEWNAEGNHRKVASFPITGLRYQCLAADGEQVGALARQRDTCCVLFRAIRPPHLGELET
ncbi:MAG: serine/threonine-protein kinase [Gemmataceae bacterium]